MTANLWIFDGIATERREALLTQFDFDTLITAIQLEAQDIRLEKDKGTHEAKGSWRLIFRFDVSCQTFDIFFNSPYGYRGEYLFDPEVAKKNNCRLIAALIDKLLAGTSETAECLTQMRFSLASEHAKIWIEEDQHNPRTPELIVEIRVPEWEAAASAVHKRLSTGDSTLTPKEVDRIYGVRAPIGRTLKVIGAWIRPDGTAGVVPSKLRRAEDIRAYGIS